MDGKQHEPPTPHTEIDDYYESGRLLAARIMDEFDFDFVGVSFVPDEENPELNWQCASGNTNNRYRRIILPSKVGVLGRVFDSRRSLIVEDVERDIERSDLYQYPIVAAESLTGFLAFPLFEGNRLANIVLCAYRARQTTTEDSTANRSDKPLPAPEPDEQETRHSLDRHLLEEVRRFAADEFGLAYEPHAPIVLHKTHSEPVYTEITHKILQAQEEERKRVARELHDGLSQELLVAQIELRKLKYLPPEQKDKGIEKASEKLREIMGYVNEMATGLRPAALGELGLETAILSQSKVLQASFGVQITVDAKPLEDIEQDREIALYRIFQEAASNACKYSRSDSIEVTLDCREGFVELTVADQGIGFNVQSPHLQGGGLGLEGMRERAGLFGGSLEVSSQEGTGTTVCARIPINPGGAL